ncbi:hypothetical protein Cme02nite_35320 [Catellatospora methionotrophica]|uniref:Uncharacterized protein n=1 Tax=Catellatospora methionotrophica TaxID=121620 RepID=A0A8J3LAH9_9ACTN|nr:hypothetical protein [Catellatospora methionotrophica]GIG15200.1 hypothetical protein Cme02nite_35320 [Catellatospora methionotrophica]
MGAIEDGDRELGAMRQSNRYSVTVRSMRVSATGFAALVTLSIIGWLTGSAAIKPLLILVLVATGLSVVVGWVGVLTVVPATRRYTRVASGTLHFRRSDRLVSSLIRDMADFRRW